MFFLMIVYEIDMSIKHKTSELRDQNELGNQLNCLKIVLFKCFWNYP